ncbi:hypothetical protein N7488_009162 [Penicillium malachiteum]|nr:hypothetical protein N7488_009162 [Penicillium malachiteum]
MSIHHYSIYCNGHFYHLSKHQKLNGARPILKDEDVSHEGSADYKYRRMNQTGPLVAYHLGKTDYHPDQIYKISKWVIAQMGLYDLFKSNCQHFVLSLAVRIICSRRDTTVFMGHTLQIVHQDRLRRLHGVSGRNSNTFTENGFHTGFYLSKPNEKMENWFQIYRRKTEIEVDFVFLKYLWAYGVDGLIPHDILEHTRWKRSLLITPSMSLAMRFQIAFGDPLRPGEEESVAFPVTAFLGGHGDKDYPLDKVTDGCAVGEKAGTAM